MSLTVVDWLLKNRRLCQCSPRNVTSSRRAAVKSIRCLLCAQPADASGMLESLVGARAGSPGDICYCRGEGHCLPPGCGRPRPDDKPLALCPDSVWLWDRKATVCVCTLRGGGATRKPLDRIGGCVEHVGGLLHAHSLGDSGARRIDTQVHVWNRCEEPANTSRRRHFRALSDIL